MEKRLLIDHCSIKPSHPDFEVLGIFNPAVVEVNGETIMIARVSEIVKNNDHHHVVIPTYRHKQFVYTNLSRYDAQYDFSDHRVIKNHHHNYLTSLSHFRIARSVDGINFSFDNQPTLFPDNIYEEYGIEDPRITTIDDIHYISYTAVSSFGINVSLMKTSDFVHFERLGNIFHFDNKDCVIFPEKINGRYYALHRPSSSQFAHLDIWLADSDDLIRWGNHRVLEKARVDYQTSARVGAGSVPFLTDKGWVVIYHSADENHRYHLTAMVLDKNDPSHIIKKSKEPLVFPSESYEKEGFMKDVIFMCGHIKNENTLHLYYGVCDQKIARCTLTMDELWANLKDVS
jgi:beta-1,2-mannobiose phosphorylase / 1,2-beta-oligomannan phosphorylase